MGEWMTTGEMIDSLKVGEVAECVNDNAYKGVKIKRSEHGLNFIKSGGDFVITKLSLQAKWIILPNYVSFEEAMKALKKGKNVKVHFSDGTNVEFYEADTVHSTSTKFGCVSWGMLAQLKWTIKDE